MYARVAAWRAATAPSGVSPAATYAGILAPLTAPAPEVVVSADEAESQAMEACGAAPAIRIAPKRHIGNLFAAAAAAQVALGAALARRSATGTRVLANTFGFGSEQAAFLLEAV